MAKKHQRIAMYDLPNNFFDAAAKKTFKPTIEDPTIKENLCFIDKAINIFLDYWSNQMEKLITAVKIFLLT